MTDSLAALAQRARYEMECLGYPARPWVRPHLHAGAPVHDVVIVGGGQSGLSTAFRLQREQVTNCRVLDRNPAGQEGPWTTFARMTTLRTPKTVTGPDLGIPSLSMRAWWEARFGPASWASLGKIPRGIWQEYLQWLRATAGIDVTNSAEVTDIEPIDGGLLRVRATIAGRAERLLTRNVVLATGIEGSGCWLAPEMVTSALPRRYYAHTCEPIDFAALAGRRVAVLGAGASAFDNAAMALEAGAARVDLLARRTRLPAVNPNRWMEFAGFMRHFGDLDDARKWRFMKAIFDMSQPPPQETFDRCTRFANFDLRLGSPVESTALAGDAIQLTCRSGVETYDFLIVATGFVVDLARRPELARFAGQIALWSDRYQPPPSQASATLGAFPYLSGNFQFTEKTPGAAPFLRHVFSYTFGAMPSLAGSAGISALKFGVERLALGITRELFLQDADEHFHLLQAYDEPELDPASFQPSRQPVSIA